MEIYPRMLEKWWLLVWPDSGTVYTQVHTHTFNICRKPLEWQCPDDVSWSQLRQPKNPTIALSYAWNPSVNSLFQQSKHQFLIECKRQTWFKALVPPSFRSLWSLQRHFLPRSAWASESGQPSSLRTQFQSWQRLTVPESPGAEREEESLCFYHQDPQITASGLTICGGFSPGSWQVGILGATFRKAKVMSALKTARKRISPCDHHWIPAALSSQTCESSLSSLTEFCHSLLMGQGRQTLMELTDVARPPQQQPGQRSAGLFPVTGGPWPLFLKRAWIKRHSG